MRAATLTCGRVGEGLSQAGRDARSLGARAAPEDCQPTSRGTEPRLTWARPRGRAVPGRYGSLADAPLSPMTMPHAGPAQAGKRAPAQWDLRPPPLSLPPRLQREDVLGTVLSCGRAARPPGLLSPQFSLAGANPRRVFPRGPEWAGVGRDVL